MSSYHDLADNPEQINPGDIIKLYGRQSVCLYDSYEGLISSDSEAVYAQTIIDIDSGGRPELFLIIANMTHDYKEDYCYVIHMNSSTIAWIDLNDYFFSVI